MRWASAGAAIYISRVQVRPLVPTTLRRSSGTVLPRPNLGEAASALARPALLLSYLPMSWPCAPAELDASCKVFRLGRPVDVPGVDRPGPVPHRVFRPLHVPGRGGSSLRWPPPGNIQNILDRGRAVEHPSENCHSALAHASNRPLKRLNRWTVQGATSRELLP